MTTNLAVDQLTIPRTSFYVDFWRSFRRHKLAVLSLVLLLIICFVAIFAAQVMPYDPNATNTAYAVGKPQPPTINPRCGPSAMLSRFAGATGTPSGPR